MSHDHLEIFAGTASGTLLSVSVLPTTTDIVHTAILGVVGAVFGFITTLGLKLIVKYLKKQ
jgi:hypothetical protein